MSSNTRAAGLVADDFGAGQDAPVFAVGGAFQRAVRAVRVLFGASLLALATTMVCGCGPTTKNRTQNQVEQSEQEGQMSIGTATMDDDGNIIMQLRAEGEDGEVGDAQFVYTPDDPYYDQILEHLGGLTPGESKPVPPFD